MNNRIGPEQRWPNTNTSLGRTAYPNTTNVQARTPNTEHNMQAEQNTEHNIQPEQNDEHNIQPEQNAEHNLWNLSGGSCGTSPGGVAKPPWERLWNLPGEVVEPGWEGCGTSVRLLWDLHGEIV